jgi:hypothetical protein
MHNIVSSKQTKIKQQYCKLVDINNKTDFNEEQHIIMHSKQIMKQHRKEIFSSIKKKLKMKIRQELAGLVLV